MTGTINDLIDENARLKTKVEELEAALKERLRFMTEGVFMKLSGDEVRKIVWNLWANSSEPIKQTLGYLLDEIDNAEEAK